MQIEICQIFLYKLIESLRDIEKFRVSVNLTKLQ